MPSIINNQTKKLINAQRFNWKIKKIFKRNKTKSDLLKAQVELSKMNCHVIEDTERGMKVYDSHQTMTY